ncbi:amidohydrolase [Flavobacterium sp. CS20]|uniref:amidohydrolase n=1 Tax=Flavobacterium sp. CS20 TaxID=2775246 RepID=UPI001B3A5386|nr:amidohydrolase [Flavobacterium sp. CS20]QTY26281.1 amidohydrolase [Flavobacterium sp. CS20]
MASKNLIVSIIQTELTWENKDANFKKFDDLINAIELDTDLIVLPEMFSTGFSMNAEKLYDEPEGQTLDWLQHHAKAKQVAITGSAIIKDQNQYFNRLFFVEPNGNYKTYDKRHLFTLAGEEKHYSAGQAKLIVDYKGWKICPLVCYDLRFPVWIRNQEDYDLLIFVANWPAMRVKAWDALLQARAIENMSYTIGVNRIGEDGKGYPHCGHSAIYDALGEKITTDLFEEAFVETKTLSKQGLLETREKFGFLRDRDEFKVN